MNRAELTEFIATDMEITKAQADRFISCFTDAVYTNIRKEGVKIVGFGTFSSAKRKARMGRNPQTGDEVKIPARWAVTFKAGSVLKDAAAKTAAAKTTAAKTAATAKKKK